MTAGEKKASRVRLIGALVLFAVFAAGAAAGWGASGWLAASAPAGPPPRGGLDLGPPELRALDLTPEQRAKAHEIGERHRPELEAIRAEVAPKVRAVHEAMKKELDALLTPEQRGKQDELEARRPAHGPPGLDIGLPGPQGNLPPPEAIEACADKPAGDACRFDGPRGPVDGSCRRGPHEGSPLACAPQGAPESRPMR